MSKREQEKNSRQHNKSKDFKKKPRKTSASSNNRSYKNRSKSLNNINIDLSKSTRNKSKKNYPRSTSLNRNLRHERIASFTNVNISKAPKNKIRPRSVSSTPRMKGKIYARHRRTQSLSPYNKRRNQKFKSRKSSSNACKISRHSKQKKQSAKRKSESWDGPAKPTKVNKKPLKDWSPKELWDWCSKHRHVKYLEPLKELNGKEILALKKEDIILELENAGASKDQAESIHKELYENVNGIDSKYEIGQLVRVRDHGKNWKYGKVTEIHPIVKVKPGGWADDFKWDEIAQIQHVFQEDQDSTNKVADHSSIADNTVLTSTEINSSRISKVFNVPWSVSISNIEELKFHVHPSLKGFSTALLYIIFSYCKRPPNKNFLDEFFLKFGIKITDVEWKLESKDITDQECLTICYVLDRNNILKTLNLYDNQIGDTGAKSIANLLECNGTLIKVYLGSIVGGNNIGDEGASALANSLEVNTTLKELWLRRNKIGDIGAKNIARALKTNTTLTRLIVNDNPMTEKGKTLLKNVHKNHPSCIRLDC